MFARLTGFVVVVFLFLGSMGIPLYEHYCAHEQLTIHTLFAESTHCEPEQQQHEDACCAVENGPKADRKDCCSDQLKNLSLSFHYFEQLKHTVFSWISVPYQEPFISAAAVSVPDADSWHFPDVADPPPIRPGTYLPRICSWLL